MTEEYKGLDDISTEEFRNLQEAPLTPTDEDNENADNDATAIDEPLAPTGESLFYQETEDQINTFGGPVRHGIQDSTTPVEPDENIPHGGWVEILEADMDDVAPSSIHSPEMSDMNIPGEIDIEDLDEDDVDGTDIPEDARLDRLEE